ncbi:hypothetical protein Q5752_002805 [Cryptotrichosporon argae]
MSVFNTSRLVGKTALITGASSGIGASTALLFARAGAHVVLLARRADALADVQTRVRAAHAEAGYEGNKVVVVQADVGDRKALDGVLGQTDGLEVDILVNNAGLVRGREHVGDIADADIDVMFQTNVIGLIHLTQLFVREFKRRNTGTIINLGSIAGLEPYAGGSIYCATKHAVNAFSGALLRELVDTPIRVVEIQPGMVETEFSLVRFRGDRQAADDVYKGLQPRDDDIAEEIVWAASRPPHVNIAQMLVFPVAQASATINHRSS